jgi:hypothetical protein
MAYNMFILGAQDARLSDLSSVIAHYYCSYSA